MFFFQSVEPSWQLWLSDWTWPRSRWTGWRHKPQVTSLTVTLSEHHVISALCFLRAWPCNTILYVFVSVRAAELVSISDRLTAAQRETEGDSRFFSACCIYSSCTVIYQNSFSLELQVRLRVNEAGVNELKMENGGKLQVTDQPLCHHWGVSKTFLTCFFQLSWRWGSQPDWLIQDQLDRLI